MDEARDKALTLAQEAETKDGPKTAEAVLERAKKYLAFLCGEDVGTMSRDHQVP